MLSVKASMTGDVRAKLAELSEQYSRFNRQYVAVGWHGDEKYPNGTSVALVATINEFGSRNPDGSVRNPKRPFMRPAYRDNKAAIDRLRTSVVQKVTDGKITAEKALDTLGYNLQLWIQAKIKSNPGKELRPSTVAKKRAAGRPVVTLIDTRRMLDTLNYRIYNGYFSAGEQTANLQAMQRANEATSQKIHGAALERVSRMRTAKQVKAAKEALRAELRAAKAAKVRADRRAAKKVRTATRKAKRKATRAYESYLRSEARKVRKETKRVRGIERRAKRSKAAAGRRYVKMYKARLRTADAKTRRMARRDKRQAKGLPRIAKLSKKQKEAKLARAKLVQGNLRRLRNEKRAEQKEIKAERDVRNAAKAKVRSANQAAKRAQKREAKAVRKAVARAKKMVRKQLNAFLTGLEKGTKE